MTVRLPDDLAIELELAGDVPLRVESPRNHKHYLIIAEDRFENGKPDAAPTDAAGDWTALKNARRFALIDQEIAGSISPAEAAELQQLQREIDEYLRRVAPLPLSAARELHERLRQSFGTSPPT